ncbi:unnamed protein product, partial [marine sediment metagenome]
FAANRRAEAYWQVRMYADPAEGFEGEYLVVACEGEAVERLASQLTDAHYGYDGQGRVKLESKEDIRKRDGKSPDEADAVVLAFAPTEDTGIHIWRV